MLIIFMLLQNLTTNNSINQSIFVKEISKWFTKALKSAAANKWLVKEKLTTLPFICTDTGQKFSRMDVKMLLSADFTKAAIKACDYNLLTASPVNQLKQYHLTKTYKNVNILIMETKMTLQKKSKIRSKQYHVMGLKPTEAARSLICKWF